MYLSKKALAITPSLTLGISAMAKDMQNSGKDVISFGAGEPDFDTPEYIKLAATDAIARGLTKYTPASGIIELKEAVCARYKKKYNILYKSSQVVISSGAKHSLFNTFQAILNPGDEVIILSPFWLTYPELVKMADGVPVFVPCFEEDNFEPRAEEIERRITDKTRAIIVNSPSNPCGCVFSSTALEKIAEIARRHDLYIVSDEIYDELVYGTVCHSIAAVSDDARARTIVINGMSKAYSMTGWRIGYTIAPDPIAKVMGSFQSHSTSNPCSIAQYASVAALNGPQEDMRAMVNVFGGRSVLMAQLINNIEGASCITPQGAFYAFINIAPLIGKHSRTGTIDGSVSFCELLLKEQLVAAVPGVAFGSDHHIRLSYATSEQNIRMGVERIAQFCRSLE